MTTGLTYTRNGDYMFPNLQLKEQPDEPIGKYGLMRETFLQTHRKIRYNGLILKEMLTSHLLEIDQAANKRLEQLMVEMTEKNPPPDKATNQMGWVRHMDNLKTAAEEVVLNELVYV